MRTPMALHLALMTALTLSGCAVGPAFRTPVTPMPAAYVATTAPAAQPATAPTTQPSTIDLVHWWTTFNDPTLTTLVTQAIDSNLDVKQAEARLLQARAARGVVAADFWPNVNGSANYTRSRTPITNDKGATGNSFSAGFDAAWEIDIFGGVRRNIEAANADIQAAVEDRRDVLVTLTSEVALNYLNLRGFQRQIVVAQDNLVAQQHSASITRQRQGAGFVSSLDVANAEAQVATTASLIPTLQASAQQTIFNLSVLLGREPAALLAQLSPPANLPPTPPVIPAGLPAELLRRRPDIRRAEDQIHGATARIGVATADLFPKISLTGSLGLQSQQLMSLANAGSRFWSFGPTVSWPVFDAGRIFSNITVQDALTRQALLTYQKSVLTALQDVDSALVAFEKEQERRQSLAAAVAANRRAVDTSTLLYTNGQTDFLNVLSAQNALFSSQDALVQSERNLDQNLVALYKALGGGWQDEVSLTPATSRPGMQKSP